MEDYVKILRQALMEEYSKPRKGAHVSDFVNCPRKKVFGDVRPVPLTDRELNFFSSGKAIHGALESLFMKHPERFEHEKEVWYGNVVAHVDMYDKINNVPIEAKTRRVAKADKPKSFHVEQLKYYMAMLDADTGVILYQLLQHFDSYPFVTFEIKMTKDERKAQLQKLLDEADSLMKARTAKDPSIARHVFNDPDMRWLCEESVKAPDGKWVKVPTCPYYHECKKMREAERATQQQL